MAKARTAVIWSGDGSYNFVLLRRRRLQPAAGVDKRLLQRGLGRRVRAAGCAGGPGARHHGQRQSGPFYQIYTEGAEPRAASACRASS
jgi:hypothetical protein